MKRRTRIPFFTKDMQRNLTKANDLFKLGLHGQANVLAAEVKAKHKAACNRGPNYRNGRGPIPQ